MKLSKGAKMKAYYSEVLKRNVTIPERDASRTDMMEELLEKVTHEMWFACEDLREALSKSNQVEGILVLELLRKANELKRDVETLFEARSADAKEQR